MHTAIEHRLDVMELERQGKQRRDLMNLFTQYRELPEVREAMKAVYGWDDNCYETGYRHMKLYISIVYVIAAAAFLVSWILQLTK